MDEVHGLSLREVEPSDFANVIDLWRELMGLHRPLSPQFELADDADDRFATYLYTALERDDYRVQLALLGPQPVGFYVACVLPNSPVYRARNVGYINDLVVTRMQRGRGIGRVLVDDAVRWLRRHEADSIELYVAEGNERGRRFWERMGAQVYLRRMHMGAAS